MAVKLTLQQQMNNNKASVSWARWSWRERLDSWIQSDVHTPVARGVAGAKFEIDEYRIGEKGVKISPRTLCQWGSASFVSPLLPKAPQPYVLREGL